MNEERTNTSLKVLRFAAIGVAVLAAGALVLSLLVEEDEEEPGPPDAGAKQITQLSGEVQAEALEAAIEDPTVKGLVDSDEIDRRSKAIPWVAEGGTELLGSMVRVRLKEPLNLDAEKLPALITPDRDAPPSTPDLRRFVRYTGTGFTELKVLMSLPSKEVLEIAPEGSGAFISNLQLIGPPLGEDYRGTGGY